MLYMLIIIFYYSRQMNKKINKKIFLSNIFVRLDIHDMIALATIRVQRTKDIKILMRYIDSSDLGNIFFGYEIIQMEKYHTCDIHQQKPHKFCIVLAYDQDNFLNLQTYFRSQQQLFTLQSMQIVSIGSLYKKMSMQTLRVSNRIFFDRMKFDNSKYKTIKNIFLRLFLTRNILCLSLLDRELKYIEDRTNIKEDQQRQQLLLNLMAEQKKLQLYIDGQYYIDMQIYLPYRHRKILYFIIDKQYQTNKDLIQEYLQLIEKRDQLTTIKQNKGNKISINKEKQIDQELDLVKLMQKLILKEKNIEENIIQEC